MMPSNLIYPDWVQEFTIILKDGKGQEFSNTLILDLGIGDTSEYVAKDLKHSFTMVLFQLLRTYFGSERAKQLIG